MESQAGEIATGARTCGDGFVQKVRARLADVLADGQEMRLAHSIDDPAHMGSDVSVLRSGLKQDQGARTS
jgi:hypothetical protein